MENGMDDKRFVNPIYVADGPRMIRQISSLDDAINFLQAMPKPVNGTVQETALKACCRAASGQMSVDYARSAFEGSPRFRASSKTSRRNGQSDRKWMPAAGRRFSVIRKRA
jgi:hypothetical protein